MTPKTHLYFAFQTDVLEMCQLLRVATNISTNNPFISTGKQADS